MAKPAHLRKRAPTRTSWGKGGPSPNPKGRPKEIGHVRALAREYTEQAIMTLVDCLSDPRGSTRVAAACALLDRGYGKPEQAITDSEGRALGGIIILPAETPI